MESPGLPGIFLTPPRQNDTMGAEYPVPQPRAGEGARHGKAYKTLGDPHLSGGGGVAGVRAVFLPVPAGGLCAVRRGVRSCLYFGKGHLPGQAVPAPRRGGPGGPEEGRGGPRRPGAGPEGPGGAGAPGEGGGSPPEAAGPDHRQPGDRQADPGAGPGFERDAPPQRQHRGRDHLRPDRPPGGASTTASRTRPSPPRSTTWRRSPGRSSTR